MSGVHAICGGRNARPNEFKYMAQIVHKDSKTLICGGTVISERHVLTAAHCVYTQKESWLLVVLGSIFLKGEGRDEYDVEKIKIRKYFAYDSSVHKNDIAILIVRAYFSFPSKLVKFFFNIITSIVQLTRPAPLSPSGPIDKAELPIRPINGNVRAMIAGWGSTGAVDDNADILQKLESRTMSLELCKRFRTNADQRDDAICAYTGFGQGPYFVKNTIIFTTLNLGI